MKRMTTRSLTPAMLAAAAALLCFSPLPAASQNDALRVLISNGMKGSIEDLQPLAEKAIGRPLSIAFSSTAGLKEKIAAGETFDATIITVQAIDGLIQQGKLTAASRKNIGRSQLGIGIRSGTPKPDIHTVEALKKSLLAAKSITYPQDGASRGDLEKMFERLGIAAELKPKIMLAPGSGPAAESVAEGKAAMVLTLFSEIVPTKGLEILGPLPGEYQSDVKFAAAISATSKNADAATALIAFLTGPKAAPVLKAKGIDPQ